jgi:hypothetical protein
LIPIDFCCHNRKAPNYFSSNQDVLCRWLTVEYIFRLLQKLGKAKTSDIVNEIIKYNPSQIREADSLRKTVNRCWRELLEAKRVSVIEGKARVEGNTYYPKNK